jgi:hypothetical protein
VNLNAIAKRVTHEETLPWRRPAIVSFHAGRLQSGSQAIHVGALKTEMSLRVLPEALFLGRQMNIESTCVEPYAAANAKRPGFGNLAQSKVSGVKGTREVLAALWHGDVDVGKVHGTRRRLTIQYWTIAVGGQPNIANGTIERA